MHFLVEIQMFKTIGVLGAGQMGSGIAQVAAASGFDVVMYDIKETALEKAKTSISGSLDRLIKKEVLTATQKDEILKKLKTTTQFNDLKTCGLAIEAVTENENLKLDIFRNLIPHFRRMPFLPVTPVPSV